MSFFFSFLDPLKNPLLFISIYLILGFQGPICSLESLGLELFIGRYCVLAIRASLGQNTVKHEKLSLYFILAYVEGRLFMQ